MENIISAQWSTCISSMSNVTDLEFDFVWPQHKALLQVQTELPTCIQQSGSFGVVNLLKTA